jgi:hypothetical protein
MRKEIHGKFMNNSWAFMLEKLPELGIHVRSLHELPRMDHKLTIRLLWWNQIC